jgi:hypothetical protein
MSGKKLPSTMLALALLLCVAGTKLAGEASWTVQPSASGAPKSVGTIKTIAGNTVTLTDDKGSEVTVQVQDSAKILRAVPGQDLKEATPISLKDLQAGDRVLVRGKVGDSEKALTATVMVAMKKTDIAQKQQHDLQEWQRHGVGGLVKQVDPAAATVTISTMTAAGANNVAVKISKDTVVRRYAPDSVKFDDAKLSTLDQVKPGDQLRARGSKNADGTEIVADEVVSGTFRNVSGLISAVDAAKNTITVNDLATRKPVTVRISNESQMHKLPPMMAQRMAMRLKGENPQNGPASNRQAGEAGARPFMGPHPEAMPGGAGEGRAGSGDLAQALNRMPVVALADLAKGEAVMVVTTAGSANSDATAVTLLSGVEPILTASPNGRGAASLLTPWSLSTGAADAVAAGPQ